MKQIGTVISAGILVGMFALSVAPAQKWSCGDDAAKFCKDVKPGGGRIVACLQGHKPDLSEACKKQLESGTARAKAARDACKSDIEKWCKNVSPGGGRILKCLEEHQAELSSECKTHVGK